MSMRRVEGERTVRVGDERGTLLDSVVMTIEGTENNMTGEFHSPLDLIRDGQTLSVDLPGLRANCVVTHVGKALGQAFDVVVVRFD